MQRARTVTALIATPVPVPAAVVSAEPYEPARTTTDPSGIASQDVSLFGIAGDFLKPKRPDGPG